MKIGEVLELTKEKRLSEIAKEYLTIGEKPAREALKNAGCYSISGKKGWHFDGDKEVLNKSIYEFSNVSSKQTKNVNSKEQTNESDNVLLDEKTKEPINVTIDEIINENNNELTNEKAEAKNTTEQPNNETTEEQKITRKRVSFDLDVALMKQIKIKSVMDERNLYELVEEALQDYLNK